MWTYEQPTGKLFNSDGEWVATGYSGFGEGLNAPQFQEVVNVGPIPLGTYLFGAPYNTYEHGPYVLGLEACPGTNLYNRSGFLIHGDETEHPGQHLASHGCIVLSRAIRMAMWQSGDHKLDVVMQFEKELVAA